MYYIVDAQVVVYARQPGTYMLERYISEALAAKNSVKLIRSVKARELTDEELGHFQQEAPQEDAR